VVRNNSRNRNISDLGSGLRQAVLDATGRYSDRGYNTVLTTRCQNAAHRRAY
jgi:hypothetical protein